jgi:hypothetical protein
LSALTALIRSRSRTCSFSLCSSRALQ